METSFFPSKALSRQQITVLLRLPWVTERQEEKQETWEGKVKSSQQKSSLRKRGKDVS